MKAIKKIVMITLFVLTSAVFGYLVGTEMQAFLASVESLFGYMLVLTAVFFAVFLALFLQIIIHEAGHLVFGLMTGYRFSSFRLGGLMWIKQDGRIRFKRFRVAGTAGQCLLTPPMVADGTCPYVLYNLGGGLFNILTAVFCLPVLLLSESGVLRMFLLLMCGIGGIFACMNLIPMKAGGIANDGYNALSLGKNKNALRAFRVQMLVNEAQASGIRVKDMPYEWFTMPAAEDMKNVMCSALAVARTNFLMDMHAFAEARVLIDTLLSDSAAGSIEILGVYRKLMTCDRIFCALMEGDTDTANKLLTKEQRDAMKQMKTMLSVIRTEYVLALLYDKNPGAATGAEALFEKHAARYPHPADILSERELMLLAKERAEMLFLQ